MSCATPGPRPSLARPAGLIRGAGLLLGSALLWAACARSDTTEVQQPAPPGGLATGSASAHPAFSASASTAPTPGPATSVNASPSGTVAAVAPPPPPPGPPETIACGGKACQGLAELCCVIVQTRRGHVRKGVCAPLAGVSQGWPSGDAHDIKYQRQLDAFGEANDASCRSALATGVTFSKRFCDSSSDCPDGLRCCPVELVAGGEAVLCSDRCSAPELCAGGDRCRTPQARCGFGDRCVPSKSVTCGDRSCSGKEVCCAARSGTRLSHSCRSAVECARLHGGQARALLCNAPDACPPDHHCVYSEQLGTSECAVPPISQFGKLLCASDQDCRHGQLTTMNDPGCKRGHCTGEPGVMIRTCECDEPGQP